MMADTTHQFVLELVKDINEIAIIDGTLNGMFDIINGLTESFS